MSKKQLLPITWEELKKYDGNPPPKALTRLPNINIAYRMYNKKLSQSSGVNANEFITKKLTNEYPSEYNIITKNKFPYYLDPQILHLVLWINPLYESDAKNTEQAIRGEIAAKLNDKNADFVLYENLPKHRSISTVRHYQLFVLCSVGKNDKIDKNDKNDKNDKKEIENKLLLKPMF